LDDAEYVRERLGIIDCEMLIRVDRIVRAPCGEVLSYESRYFIGSLDPSTVIAAQLQLWIRGHWQIENCLHFTKDRWWDEDRHSLRRPGLGERYAALLNAALSVLRTLHEPDRPLKATAELIQWRPSSVLEQLGF
jgi:hypothetical protein